jgi:hypothetical protein
VMFIEDFMDFGRVWWRRDFDLRMERSRGPILIFNY